MLFADASHAEKLSGRRLFLEVSRCVLGGGGSCKLVLYGAEFCDLPDFGGRVCCFGGRSEGGVVYFYDGCLVVSFSQIIWCHAGERVFEDSTDGAVQLTSNYVSTSNSKNIDRCSTPLLKELVAKVEIMVIHIKSEFKHADYLTKSLDTGDFRFRRDIVINNRIG